MYSRYAASEGKNLSDAIGAILKRVIRNKILKQRGTEETIEMGIDLEDTNFKNYSEFIEWLKVQVKWQEIKGFDKFDSFTVIDVKEPNLRHAVNENEIRKFVGLKKYHCMFAEKDLENEVMFRLATCVCVRCVYRDNIVIVLKCYIWSMGKPQHTEK